MHAWLGYIRAPHGIGAVRKKKYDLRQHCCIEKLSFCLNSFNIQLRLRWLTEGSYWRFLVPPTMTVSGIMHEYRDPFHQMPTQLPYLKDSERVGLTVFSVLENVKSTDGAKTECVTLCHFSYGQSNLLSLKNRHKQSRPFPTPDENLLN